jgi:hypothetical protein
VSTGVPDFEERLSNLQAQMERLRHLPGGDVETADQRLALLTDQCAEIVRRWAVTSERHARAVSRLEAHLSEWTDAGTRLQEDAAHRFGELERIVHQEWRELRDIHQEPARQLHEHATNLTQVCITTAHVVQQSVERAEARLSAIEAEIDRRLADIAREIQTVVADIRARQGVPAERLAAAPWQLEGVTRLHHQLRQGQPGSPVSATLPQETAPQGGAALALPEASVLTERLETLERAVGDRDARIREATQQSTRTARAWRMAVAGLAVLIAAVGIFAWQMRTDLRARMEQAQRDARAASDAAARDVASARDAAAREVKEATDRATRAQTMVEVMAAPDVVRYSLVGQDMLADASAQLRWSRSRGITFSGSRMKAPPDNSTYQVWMLTRTGAVPAMTFTPDASGTATVTVPPLQVPRPVVGAMVTLEPAAGSSSPTGPTVLARPPEPEPSPAPGAQ